MPSTQSPSAAGPPSAGPWWADAIGYEVYIRSFADADGDGIGDLPGLTSRLDHIADLGVDIVWVTPFFPSPMADFGYDVADYCDIDPRFGTLDDLDRLVAGVHERGMRLLVDLVPNHTSDQHEWFRSALAGPGAPYRDFYLWRDPAPDGGPPNNWVSHFGGPAWTLDETSGQYWCHLFLPEQPDLDWSNPAVHEAFVGVVDFWLDRGVDGFRIDVAQGLVKHESLADNPWRRTVPDDASPRTTFRAMDHVHDLDQEGNVAVYREWNRRTAARDAALLGEVYLEDATAVERYVAPGALDLAFYFPTLHTAWDADELGAVIDAGLRHGRGRFAWVHSSHDDPRAPTRFGGGDAGRRRALAALTLTAFLPGPTFLYQGDELGLENGLIPPGHAADPVAVRNADASDGRDAVRTPIPWDPDAPNLGFSTGTPWMPVGRNHGPGDTAAHQWADPGSHLHAVRRMIAVRRTLLPLPDDVTRLDFGPGVLAYRRGSVTVGVAVGVDVETDLATAGLGPDATLVFAHGGAALAGGRLLLPEGSVAVLHDR